ncbi:sodium/myo-inositol cotransporter [Erythrolamprus reginae]|uniref:sodium/myo-inositol cotransporter n=1 Tax=Erythrolamprus reginae TaxID=121349 RepID=UPI00396CD9BD
MRAALQPADIAIVALYFVVVLSIGFFAMWKSNRSTVSGYFLAGRSMTWVIIGASLFVSNIGSEHFIGLAGSGAASGFAVGAWEFNALMLLQLLGWIFVPVYIQSGIYTMPGYLAKRFGGHRIQVYFAVLSLILYVFTKLSVDLYSGALFIQESLGWNIYLSVILLIGMTALLTVTGGLVAVIYTDTVQALLMIIGAFTLMIISLTEVGGFEEVKRRYMLSKPNITSILLTHNLSNTNYCNADPKPDALKMLREPTDEDIPWPGFILGQTPASVWYWCADQVIVQRVLAAKNIAHAKGSTLMAGFLKLLPMFLIVIPGMISRILFVDDIACINPEHCMKVCGSRAGCSNIAYPRLVMNLVPVGLRGLMMAVMIAALMSDLDSIFNSASTIFTLDIYKLLIRKNASSRELMIVGRVFVAFMVVISIAWVPIIVEMQGGQMYLYIQEVANYLTPPVAAIFLLGVFWKRCNEQGAFFSGIVGFALGATRLILAFVYRVPECNQPDTRPFFIKSIHYMYVATGLFWITGIVAVIVSFLTPPPSAEQICATTFWSTKKRTVKESTLKGSPYEAQRKNILKYGVMVSSNGKSEQNVKNDQPENVNLLITSRDDSNPVISFNSEVETPVDCYSNGQAALMGNKKSEEEIGSNDKDWKFINWFCGFKSENFKNGAMEDKREEETICLQMLEETPKVKLLLNVGLFCACFLGIFMFVYFSL